MAIFEQAYRENEAIPSPTLNGSRLNLSAAASAYRSPGLASYRNRCSRVPNNWRAKSRVSESGRRCRRSSPSARDRRFGRGSRARLSDAQCEERPLKADERTDRSIDSIGLRLDCI